MHAYTHIHTYIHTHKNIHIHTFNIGYVFLQSRVLEYGVEPAGENNHVYIHLCIYEYSYLHIYTFTYRHI
jgi:Holliday junction resolvasome RuvABC DNA-binding subunit